MFIPSHVAVWFYSITYFVYFHCISLVGSRLLACMFSLDYYGVGWPCVSYWLAHSTLVNKLKRISTAELVGKTEERNEWGWEREEKERGRLEREQWGGLSSSIIQSESHSKLNSLIESYSSQIISLPHCTSTGYCSTVFVVSTVKCFWMHIECGYWF